MSPTAWILIILTIAYVPLWIYAWRTGGKNRLGFEKYGPTIKINTRFGIRLMDRLCVYHRFWRGFGIYSQLVSVFLMAMMVYMVVCAVVALPATLSRGGGVGIEYALAIPGLNPIMPFWYTVIALIIALVLHELAHGMQTRTNGMRVKNTGLLYAIVPVGAFVEPDEGDVEAAPRRVKLDLYAAGIATNFIVAAVAFVVMLTMVGGLSSPYGDSSAVSGEVSGSPADGAGIPVGAIILEVRQEGSGEWEVFDYGADTHSWHPGRVEVKYAAEDGERTTTMAWGVYVSGLVEGSAADGTVEKGWTLTSVECGGVSYPMYTSDDFSRVMGIAGAGGEVTLSYIGSDGHAGTTDTVKLGGKNGRGYLGIYGSTAGMSFTTPEKMLQVALNPIHGYDSVLDYGRGFLHYIAMPFKGYDPVPEAVHWWYGDQPPGFWEIATLLYWIFWLNILLGITNALPAVPFDGGFIFRGWMDKVLEESGKKDRGERERIVDTITRNVSILMIFLFALVFVSIAVRRDDKLSGTSMSRPKGGGAGSKGAQSRRESCLERSKDASAKAHPLLG